MRREARQAFDRLLLAAAALDPDEQRVFLERLPAEERDLAGEVRRRLAAAAELPETFLLTPATEVLEAACGEAEPPDPPEGDERYEIGERLGTGGTAEVYRAFDRRLGRPVALKVLHASSRKTARGLLREARAQARVRHDHVLEVYDTGELEGRPYIAVRYVAGGSLVDWIGPARPPGLERKVRLVAQTAEGLHAAHREGLIHGDVKPSNVLVEETPDGELRAWIGDFGIATEMVETEARFGDLAGTPQYMAPELLAGDRAAADRRSDVYSLGVTLYQVLTGELPPRGPLRWKELRMHASALPPDLAAIAARCLSEDPEDRYPSARAVAEDLHRFLDGEVVEAYADRLAYRLIRFSSRHRTLLAVAGIAALLLTGALAVAAAMGARAVRANARAEKRRAQAEELIRFMLGDLRDKLDTVGRLDLLDGVGERAMKYFAAVPEAELSDEELARRSTALYQIGDVRLRRGDLAGAQRPFEESLALARKLTKRHPDDPERLFDLGQSEFWAGYAIWRRGDVKGARGHFEAYYDISRRLVARDAKNRAWRRELSYAESNLGSVLQEQGDLARALERFGAALELDRGLVADAPTPEKADEQCFELAATHNSMGLVLEWMGRLDEAQEHYGADLALRRRLIARKPENQRWREFLGTAQEYLGNLLATRGETSAARPHLEAARSTFDGLAARDPSNGDWLNKQAWSYLWLGRLEHAESHLAAARADWLRANGIAQKLVRTDPKRANWRQLLGVALYHIALGRTEEAGSAERAQLLRAVSVLERCVEEQPNDRRNRRWLVEALLLRGDLEAGADRPAAEAVWRRAAEILRPLVAGGTRDATLLAPWARTLNRLGRTSEAAEARTTLATLGVPSRGAIP